MVAISTRNLDGRRRLALPQPEGLQDAMSHLRELLGAGPFYAWAGSLPLGTIENPTLYLQHIQAKIAEMSEAVTA